MWPEHDHHCSDQFQIEWKIVLRKHVLLLLLPGTNSKVVLFLNFQQLYNRLLHSETRSIISEATDYSFSLKNVFFFFFPLISLQKKVWGQLNYKIRSSFVFKPYTLSFWSSPQPPADPRYVPCITKITNSKFHFHLSSTINSLYHLSLFISIKDIKIYLSFHKESETYPQLCDWIHVLAVIAMTEKNVIVQACVTQWKKTG